MKPLHRILASLALTTAVLTGLLTTIDDLATPADTAWGAPDTTATDITATVTPPTVDATIVTPLDTAWG